MPDILVLFIFELLVFLLVFYFFGFILWLLTRFFVQHTRTKGISVIKWTGIIGTTIHELSHAFFCLIFGHRIQEIKLFSPNDEDGTLGYVRHTYNKRNIYQRIGNFFIGIAPIIAGGLSIFGLLFLFLKDSFFAINDMAFNTDIVEFYKLPYYAVLSIFSLENLKSWQFYVFLIIAICIALHANYSNVDFKGSLSGVLFLIILMGISLIPFQILGSDTTILAIDFLKRALVYEISVFSLILVVDLALFVLVLALKLIGYIFKR